MLAPSVPAEAPPLVVAPLLELEQMLPDLRKKIAEDAGEEGIAAAVDRLGAYLNAYVPARPAHRAALIEHNANLVALAELKARHQKRTDRLGSKDAVYHIERHFVSLRNGGTQLL